MEEDIENLIEELTKVSPEMLNDEALKLFNTIMAILDERDKLKKEIKLMNVRITTKLKIAQEEYKEFNEKGQHQLALVRSGKNWCFTRVIRGRIVMEEDIKILEEKLRQWEPYKNIKFKTEIELELQKENSAIENLIKGYRNLEMELEKWKNGEM